MDTINEAIEGARHLAEVRQNAYVAPDYKRVNEAFKKQKAALTRAENSGNPEKVKAAVVKAVREWREAPFNGAWPDDWSRWQRALDDALGWRNEVLLEDIR